MKKERIDVLMVEAGLVESRNLAQRLIMAGEVSVDGERVFKPSQCFDLQARIELKNKPKYVSRGGYKLEKALREFGFENLDGKICVDVGASTGGFSDCLLQRSAAKVYSVDVGYGQLHDRLRKNPRVVVMERTNVKDVTDFPDSVDMVVIDASFISLKSILPTIIKWNFGEKLEVIALVKPQFEAGKREAAKGKGVIRSEEIHERVISEVVGAAKELGFVHRRTIESPLEGPKGNREFLIHLRLKKDNRGEA